MIQKWQNIERMPEELFVADGCLDHGFFRPKVLVLLPFRNIAYRVISRLIQLTPQVYKTNVEYMDRFLNEFGPHDDEDNGDNKQTQSVGNSRSEKSSKPSDFQALFHGNCDDNFMIGIKFTRKSIKLFNDFYSSDLIIASPFSIRCKIDKVLNKKDPDTDYLSSIEDVDDGLANLKKVLRGFEFLSGLKINFFKSSLIRINIPMEEVEAKAMEMRCRSQSFPFFYIGLPIGVSSRRKRLWDPIVAKFKSKLNSWRGRLLSFGGRLIMIKAVLSSLPIYYVLIQNAKMYGKRVGAYSTEILMERKD